VKLSLVDIGQTDAAGKIDIDVDDFNTLPLVEVSKDDYVTASFSFDKAAHEGSVQTKCLSNPPTIPDGQDPNVPGESGGQEFDGGGCFIVTATTGSASSFEVTELRALRERVRARSRLGGQLIDAIYAEYEAFSPAIADRLHGDGMSRGIVLDYIVRPLFAWYRLAGVLGLDPANGAARQDALQAFAEACPRDAPASMILGVLDAVRSGKRLPVYLPRMVHEAAPRIAAGQFAPWAILDPLIRAWRVATEGGDPVAEIADWLAATPLDRLGQPNDTRHLDTEFATIAGFLAFAPDRRHALADRLRTAWPDAQAALGRAFRISETL